MPKSKRKKKVSTISTSTKTALSITRASLNTAKAVYVARANKKIKYPWGKSFIAYIGETSIGTKRIAASAADRSEEILTEHGITSLEFYVIRSSGKQSVKTWEELERSLLLTFREKYGAIPICNDQGNKLDADRKSKYFKEDRLRTIIKKYSETEF